MVLYKKSDGGDWTSDNNKYSATKLSSGLIEI